MLEDGDMPDLYATEDIPLEEKVVHQRWLHPTSDHYRLVVEYDPRRDLAFGMVHGLHDEWRYFDIAELKEAGGYKDPTWEPCRYADGTKSIGRS